MPTVAVVARKSFGGGLRELREHFAVMAAAGFDARMTARADRAMKDGLGRVAYLYAAARSLLARRVKATVEVDGQRFFKGRVSLVLAANVGTMLGGVEVFTAAKPDDGLLELGVVTARNPVDWGRVFGRVALRGAARSPFVEMTRGRSIRVRFDRKIPYELDGGIRPPARDLRMDVHPRSVTICVPA